MLASAHQDGVVRLWQPETGALVRTLAKHRGWARGVAWSPDGLVLASTGEDRTIRLWDVATGQALTMFREHTRPVWTVAWSPDGRSLAAGGGEYLDVSSGSKVVIWEMP